MGTLTLLPKVKQNQGSRLGEAGFDGGVSKRVGTIAILVVKTKAIFRVCKRIARSLCDSRLGVPNQLLEKREALQELEKKSLFAQFSEKEAS